MGGAKGNGGSGVSPISTKSLGAKRPWIASGQRGSGGCRQSPDGDVPWSASFPTDTGSVDVFGRENRREGKARAQLNAEATASSGIYRSTINPFRPFQKLAIPRDTPRSFDFRLCSAPTGRFGGPTNLRRIPEKLKHSRPDPLGLCLDRDLAALYGVPTFRLNETVKRNADRFPADFRFQLTAEESGRLTSQSAISKPGRGGRRTLPWAFTEHGALMAATILNSPRAVQMSVVIVRAFVRLRQLLVNHKALSAKLNELDARVGAHDEQLAAIVDAVRQLAAPDGPRHRRKIGFHPGNR